MAYTLTERDQVELKMVVEHVKGIQLEAGRMMERLAAADGAELEQLRAKVAYGISRLMGVAARADLALDQVERLQRRARILTKAPSYATPGAALR